MSEDLQAQGRLERLLEGDFEYGTHGLLNEQGHYVYVLRSDEEGLLDRYIGQQVTVSGTKVPHHEVGAVEGTPDILDVSQVSEA